MNYETVYNCETGKEATFLEKGKVGLIYSPIYVEWLVKRIAALENRGRLKTVRKPVQQRKGKICPSCRGRGFHFERKNRNYSRVCTRCCGRGRLRHVA